MRQLSEHKYLMKSEIIWDIYEDKREIAGEPGNRMWTMLGSWTMSVTQLVEASSVSQKCTLPKIFSYKNNFYFPEKKKSKNWKRKKIVNISQKKKIFSIFSTLWFFFQKNISALVPFSLRVWPAKVLRFWSPRAGPLLLRVTANSSDTRSCCPWKKKIRLFCWCTKSCRYRLEKKYQKPNCKLFFSHLDKH